MIPDKTFQQAGQDLSSGLTEAMQDVLGRETATLKALREKCKHSSDFRSVVWFGDAFDFTATQAACVKVLWENWENGTSEVSQETVLYIAGSVATRLVDLFKKHPAWGKMIVSGATKGS